MSIGTPNPNYLKMIHFDREPPPASRMDILDLIRALCRTALSHALVLVPLHRVATPSYYRPNL